MRANYRVYGHETEKLGAQHVAPRRVPQRDRLLAQYGKAYLGLTDEEAAVNAGLEKSCYWKRCGELRELGYISTMQKPGFAAAEETRKGSAGVSRIVCWITAEGEDYLRSKNNG